MDVGYLLCWCQHEKQVDISIYNISSKKYCDSFTYIIQFKLVVKHFLQEGFYLQHHRLRSFLFRAATLLRE